MLIYRLLMTLIALTFIGLGLLAIVTDHYYGVSTRFGYRELTMDGQPAVSMGFGLLFLGLFPLAAWLKSKTQIVVWILVCFACAAASFVMSWMSA